MLELRSTKIILSCLLGFGLATMFRRVCDAKDAHSLSPCVQFKGPHLNSARFYKYRQVPGEDECYKYTAYAVPCHPTRRGP